MSYLGSWKIDNLLTFCVNTHRVDSGVAVDADSVPTYRVYEDETGTPILTGSMALLDSSNTAGFYSEQITLSAANGFEINKCYTIYITATVNGVTGTTNHNFKMEPEHLAVDVHRISGDTAAADNAESFFDGTGYAGTNNVIPTVTTVTGIAAGGITAASIATDAIDSDAIAASAVTEIQSGLATAASLSTVEGKIDTIDTNVDSILVDTNSIESKVDIIDGIVDDILQDTGTTGVVIAGSQIFIKRNVALPNFMFVMTSATTHVPTSGLTVSGEISIDGGAFAAFSNSVVEVSDGWYKINITQAETNGAIIAIRFTATGADELPISFVTQA